MIIESLTEMIKRKINLRELNLINDEQLINEMEISIQLFQELKK